VPTATSNAEENEAHYLKGKARASGMDYRGAIESFEEALMANPRSAAAHFQLGMLFAEKEVDPAAAIYHYQKYLDLRPNADNADVINQHIFRLKQDLAKALLPLPATPGVQREFEEVAAENRRLRDELARLRNFLTARGLSVANQPLALESRTPAGNSAYSGGRPGNPPGEIAQQGDVTVRTHRVQAGETPIAIARKYNVKLEAFLIANPRLDAKRMQIGQVVNVPGQ